VSGPRSEFARLVLLVRLGSEPFRLQIAATESERADLVRRLDLVSLDHLAAEIELACEPRGTILLSAAFEAVFEQNCIVTLDPVAGSVNEHFQLRYGSPEAEPDAPAGGDEDPAFEPLDGEAIDVGEAVAQEFSLALPPFPRAPDAVVEPASVPASEDRPFAALARFSRREPQ
jgi:uncharacterized metal-binding protein YceD (DUF177 family)